MHTHRTELLSALFVSWRVTLRDFCLRDSFVLKPISGLLCVMWERVN